MFGVVFSAKEVLSTSLALVRFHLQVNSLPVVDEGRVGLEGRPALRTQEGLDCIVDRGRMNVECGAAGEAPIAFGAAVRLLPCKKMSACNEREYQESAPVSS